ncbi:MAG: hypothetical protein RLZZ200_1965 [Pseudomonadota bacterium]
MLSVKRYRLALAVALCLCLAIVRVWGMHAHLDFDDDHDSPQAHHEASSLVWADGESAHVEGHLHGDVDVDAPSMDAPRPAAAVPVSVVLNSVLVAALAVATFELCSIVTEPLFRPPWASLRRALLPPSQAPPQFV